MGKGMTVAEIQELVPTLAVTVEPVGRLQEYAGNAKEHTAEQVEQIKASMRQVGFCDPIGVWTNAEGKSEVVEGHGRLMAALELGLAFWCAENRLRSLGDSTACCGCGDLPGFEGNRFNCVSIANGSGGPSELMRRPGTAGCFKALNQQAGVSHVIARRSFAELMTDAAGAF
ncbi:ParB N-terminal domain-containing protein [uncultured Senegalimassilia sp.]|uniref:ParB N-terminal domain-containing protein n=1 Tax=uncultured Senegalimassilia sp. TaxID=1714350 RepID=UPI0025EE93AB|nr:ParB N-terminal domain-containing protein [uncultured Senegalimassilia sp.]